MKIITSKNIQNLSLISFVAITILIWNIPGGKILLYPFTILSTWFHELAHGFSAILLGGDFHKIVIFPDGSGYAQFSYSSLFFDNIGKSIVAGAGPIGPSVIGAIFVMSSVKEKSTRIVMYLFSIFLISTSIIWIRPIISWGFFIILIFSILITQIATKANDKFKIFTLQFIAVQAFLSVYQSMGYLFSSGAIVDGNHNLSDTAVISENLFLPYWFWGAIILLINIILIYYSFNYYYKKVKIY